MTRDEIKKNSIEKELEKLEAQRERRIKLVEKKAIKAEKLGVNISEEEFRRVRDSLTSDQAYTYLELDIARDDLKDTERRIEIKKKNLEKAGARVAAYKEKKSAEEIEKEKAAEIARWAEDGIEVEVMSANYIRGKTPGGERFSIEGNHGLTERSLHCFTLIVGGDMIFSSGEFARAYAEIKRR